MQVAASWHVVAEDACALGAGGAPRSRTSPRVRVECVIDMQNSGAPLGRVPRVPRNPWIFGHHYMKPANIANFITTSTIVEPVG